MRRWLVGVTAAAVCLVAAGCSKYVSGDDVEQSIHDRIQSVAGVDADVTCDDDLPAKKDGKMTCAVALPNGKTVKARVTVDSVDGDKVRYHYRLPPNVLPDKE